MRRILGFCAVLAVVHLTIAVEMAFAYQTPATRRTAPPPPAASPATNAVNNAIQTPAVPGAATNVVPGATTTPPPANAAQPPVAGTQTNPPAGTSTAYGGAFAPATQP